MCYVALMSSLLGFVVAKSRLSPDAMSCYSADHCPSTKELLSNSDPNGFQSKTAVSLPTLDLPLVERSGSFTADAEYLNLPGVVDALMNVITLDGKCFTEKRRKMEKLSSSIDRMVTKLKANVGGKTYGGVLGGMFAPLGQKSVKYSGGAKSLVNKQTGFFAAIDQLMGMVKKSDAPMLECVYDEILSLVYAELDGLKTKLKKCFLIGQARGRAYAKRLQTVQKTLDWEAAVKGYLNAVHEKIISVGGVKTFQ